MRRLRTIIWEIKVSNEMWRYLTAGFLIVHGIGHSGGYWMFIKSWVSPDFLTSPWKWLFVAVWLVAMIGFIIAGISILQQKSGWRTVAIAASVVSLIVSALFIQGTPFNAAVADVIILVALLWVNWPSIEMLGS